MTYFDPGFVLKTATLPEPFRTQLFTSGTIRGRKRIGSSSVLRFHTWQVQEIFSSSQPPEKVWGQLSLIYNGHKEDLNKAGHKSGWLTN